MRHRITIPLLVTAFALTTVLSQSSCRSSLRESRHSESVSERTESTAQRSVRHVADSMCRDFSFVFDELEITVFPREILTPIHVGPQPTDGDSVPLRSKRQSPSASSATLRVTNGKFSSTENSSAMTEEETSSASLSEADESESDTSDTADSTVSAYNPPDLTWIFGFALAVAIAAIIFRFRNK